MLGLTVRPTIDLQIAVDCEIISDRLRQQLVRGSYPVRAETVGSHFVVSPPEQKVQLWSPWLDLELRPRENGTHVFGRFGPRPSVWTGFMCANFGLATAGFFAAMWGSAQLLLKHTPWAFWITLGCVASMALMIWASQVGQHLAVHQMEQMRGIVLEILDQPDSVEKDAAR